MLTQIFLQVGVGLAWGSRGVSGDGVCFVKNDEDLTNATQTRIRTFCNALGIRPFTRNLAIAVASNIVFKMLVEILLQHALALDLFTQFECDLRPRLRAKARGGTGRG